MMAPAGVGAEFAALESEIADLRLRVEALEQELLMLFGVLRYIAEDCEEGGLEQARIVARRALPGLLGGDPQ